MLIGSTSKYIGTCPAFSNIRVASIQFALGRRSSEADEHDVSTVGPETKLGHGLEFEAVFDRLHPRDSLFHDGAMELNRLRGGRFDAQQAIRLWSVVLDRDIAGSRFGSRGRGPKMGMDQFYVADLEAVGPCWNC